MGVGSAVHQAPYLKILNNSIFEFMFCKKSDATTEYTLRFGALVHAESHFLLPLLNEILTAHSRVPVVLATEPLSQCPFLRPVVSSAHSRSLGVDTWGVRAGVLACSLLGQGMVSLPPALAGSTIMHLLGCQLEASCLWG